MLGIRAKIVLPFTLLFLAVLLVVAALAARATARAEEARIQKQMTDLAGVLSQPGLASNPDVLRKVKALIGAELATVDSQGAILIRGGIPVTTLDADGAQALAEHLAKERPTAGADVHPPRAVPLRERLFVATFAPIEAPQWPEGQTFLYLLKPEAEIEEASHRASHPILLAAACGAVAVAVLGYLVGHALARPVQSLAAQARRLAAGDAQAPLAVRTRDEIGELAKAFNALLDSLRQAETRLVASERLAAVGQVAAGIAHEVRNPLSGIKMSAQVLKRRLRELGAAGGAGESVDVMLAEIARLEVIIEDLLTFARPTQLKPERANLNTVVNEVLDFMARQLEHAGVAVRRELDATLPDAPFDPQRIRQVVLNLVLNAAEAMPNGGTLTARTRAMPHAVVAELDDTGHGIPPETADKVFEPFFTTKRGGSGLGLGVSRTLIEAHGGTLTFEPLGKGTRFVFRIPREAPASASSNLESGIGNRESCDGQDRGD